MSSVRAGSAAVTNNAASTLTFTIPSGTQVGDRIVIWIFGNSTGRTYSAPGYTVLVPSNPGSATISGSVLIKTATAADLGQTVVVTQSSTNTPLAGLILSVAASAGIDPANTADGGQLNTASTTVTTPGRTLTYQNDLAIWLGAARSGAAGGAVGTLSGPAGYSTVVTQANTNSGTATNVGAFAASGRIAAAGATGNQNGSDSLSQGNYGCLLAFADFPGQMFL